MRLLGSLAPGVPVSSHRFCYVIVIMTIHSLYIFNRRGGCLYYGEWLRPKYALASTPDEDRKLSESHLVGGGIALSYKLLPQCSVFVLKCHNYEQNEPCLVS